MINYIHGTLTEKENGYIVVETAGVGYGINVPLTVLARLPSLGVEVKIYTYYSVKEDSQSLYGFLFKNDREMFKQLISVNGVGPRGALAILSVLDPDDLRLAIVTGDLKAISRAQGIGAKTAQRVIIDLKDRIGNDFLTAKVSADSLSSASLVTYEGVGNAVGEAIDALAALGYSRMEAARAVRRLELDGTQKTEDILKMALRAIAKL